MEHPEKAIKPKSGATEKGLKIVAETHIVGHFMGHGVSLNVKTYEHPEPEGAEIPFLESLAKWMPAIDQLAAQLLQRMGIDVELIEPLDDTMGLPSRDLDDEPDMEA